MAVKAIVLPINLVGSSDLAGILRELNSLEDFFVASKARQPGTPMQPPRITRTLDNLAKTNQYNLLDDIQRKDIANQLALISKSAPKVHISFASDPPPKALEKILMWFRTSVHPQLLLQVGLQPNIAAGCVIRTPNKFFDLSLRQYLEKQENYFIELTKGAVNGQR